MKGRLFVIIETMTVFFYLIIFIFGLAVGSFLNVLADRLPQEETIGGRSHCDHCGHKLNWQDLVPVLSFILLRGRCQYCRKKISWQYPIVELVTGILFIILLVNFWNFGFNHWDLFGIWNLVFLVFITSCLIVIFLSDLRYFIIPDEIIIAGVIGTLIYRFLEILNFGHWNLFGIWSLGFGIWNPFLIYILSALGTSLFFLLIVVATKGKGMGLGDAKLAFLMGLALGWPQILFALLFAFVFGALFGLVLILSGRATMKTRIPFGTFLAAGTFLTMIFGGLILQQYSNLFF